MRMSFWFVALPVVSLALVAGASPGCSSGGSGGTKQGSGSGSGSGSSSDAGGGSTSIASFCASIISADATYLSTCLGGAASTWNSQLTASNTCAELAAAVTAGRVKYDPTKASACIAAYTSATCGSGAATMTEAACKAAATGTVATGGTCYNSVDCSGESFCSGLGGASGACSGTCKALVAAGATCVAGDQCVAGYACGAAAGDAGTGALSCVAITTPTLAAAGATCGYDATTKTDVLCAATLVCNSQTKKCQAPIKAGLACTPNAGECDLFTYCDPSTKTCKSDPTVGGGCGQSPQQDFITCSSGSYCKFASATSLVGTCAAVGAAGAACKTGVECASKVCTLAGDAGAGTCTAACTQE